MVKFCNDNFIEKKVYLSNYIINSSNKKLVILITYDKSTFLANDDWYQAWLKKSDAFLQPKKRRKDIMISDFLLS